MANTFKNKMSRAIGLANTQIGTYSVASATTAIVIGISVSNLLTQAVSVSLFVNDGSANTNIVNGAIIPVGGSLIITDNQKIVLQNAHSIYAVSSIAASIDVIMSVLEIT